jgi:uncharacterized protein YjiK
MKNFLQLRLKSLLFSLNQDSTHRLKSFEDNSKINSHTQLDSSSFFKKSVSIANSIVSIPNRAVVLFLFMSLLGFNQNGNAQTTLSLGDLSIIGFQLNAPDSFVFTTWVDIAPNTYIKFTDNGFLSAGSANATGNVRGGENFVIWKSNSTTISAGSVITIVDGVPAVTNNGTIVSGSLSGLSASGDGIFAYQGAATSGTFPDFSANSNPTTFNGTLLFGLFAPGSSSLTSWLTTGVPTSNTSYLPSELNVANGNIAFGALASKGQYTGSRTNQATMSAYKALVTNPSNWTTSAGAGVLTFDTTSFTTVATIPTVSLSVSTTTGTEAGTTAITVTATADATVSSDQTLSLAVTGTDITAGDYTLSNTTITILSGQTTGSVIFTVVDDASAEVEETATLTISNPSTGITLGTTVTQQIVITDNDALTIDLSTYVRVGRYDLPEPTRTIPPTNSLLAQEVSAVTYNWDTDTLFVVGDGSTSIVQVSKTGQLIDSMTLAQGSSPQGTEFYDTEGLTYIGNGEFVLSEERDRQVVKFTYVANTTLTRANAQTVKLGTFVNNIGTEGLSYDPVTSGYVVAKEITPIGVFQTGIDFTAGTATNGSATTVDSVNLFDPALMGVSDIADIFALSNIPSLNGKPLYNNLLVLSQENARIVNIDRSGVIANTLNIVSDAGNPLDIASQQHEGITMDRDGIIYVVSENGGGTIDYPQLWVYAPSTVPNQAPTAVALTNTTTAILENSNTTSAVKVSDIVVTDDGLGTNVLSLSGADASFFQISGSSLYIKAGTVIDYETKTSYNVTVNVDDTTIGATPDATVDYVLSVTDVAVETVPVVSVNITEIAPWSSGNTSVLADWFEVTNNGTTALDITGWKIDDSSNAFTSAAALSGISSIAPGESVIFLETSATNTATIIANFKSAWFGANVPANLQVGSYTGSAIGLSTSGDAVNLFDSSGVVRANITFGVATTNKTFNNAAGLNNTAITTLSIVGVNDAFEAVNDSNQIGSPGTVGRLFISEVAPWSSGNSPVAADWFEITNTKAVAVDITGWKVDDNSQTPAGAVALNGITSINPGESVIFIETADLAVKTTAFLSNWFGSNPPSTLRIGSYTGTGIGLGSGGDQVNLYNATSSTPQASVLFGTSPTTIFTTFDNSAGLNGTTTAITQFSTVGTNGAFIAVNSATEIGSPGTIVSNGNTLSTNTPLEIVKAFDVIVYSIPYETEFQLDFSTKSDDQIQIKVYDMTGRLVEVRKFNTTEMNNQKLGSNYKSGIYSVVVTQGQNAKTLRMIKG